MLAITRAEDGQELGTIIPRGEVFLAVRNTLCPPAYYWVDRRPFRREHATEAAAVAWIHENPHVPGPGTCPMIQGVIGPVLATWGDIRVVGCVQYTLNAQWTFGLRKDQTGASIVLVAMDGRGLIQARIAHHDRGWEIAMAGPIDPVRRTRAHWDKTIALFRTEVIGKHVRGSQHQRLELKAQGAAFDAAATAFLDERLRLRVAFALDL